MFYLLVCVRLLPMKVRKGHPVFGSLLLCERICGMYVQVCILVCVCTHVCTNWTRMYVVLFSYYTWEWASHWAWSVVGSQQAPEIKLSPLSTELGYGSAGVCAIMPGFMWMLRSEPRTSFAQQVFLARVIYLTPCKKTILTKALLRRMAYLFNVWLIR